MQVVYVFLFQCVAFVQTSLYRFVSFIAMYCSVIALVCVHFVSDNLQRMVTVDSAFV